MLSKKLKKKQIRGGLVHQILKLVLGIVFVIVAVCILSKLAVTYNIKLPGIEEIVNQITDFIERLKTWFITMKNAK